MATEQKYSMKLPLHIGTGRGHHETIFDRDGDLVAYTASGSRDQDTIAAQVLVQAANAHAALVAAVEAALGYVENAPLFQGTEATLAAQLVAALAGTEGPRT